MAWSERQHAMLNAMGLRAWSPVAAVGLQLGPGDALPAAAPSQALPAARVADPSADPVPARRVEAPAVQARPDPVGRPAVVSTPQAGAVLEGLDWAALRQAVADCRACGLCDSRRQTVFGVGATSARWLVVGEAPGEQEDRRGEPFVGRAGQLLDQMLAALGLSRQAGADAPAQQVYIANALKCRPPGNRNPTAAELSACEPFLQRQIGLLQPRIILAMGRFAVQSLLRSDEAIGRLRGRVHQYHGVPLVVTYHPAYLLRNPPDKARAWQDLCLAADTLEAA